jgi:hypothetical protein
MDAPSQAEDMNQPLTLSGCDPSQTLDLGDGVLGTLFVEELDGPTFATEAGLEEWMTFESPYALAYEAEEYRQLSRAHS